MRGLGGLDRRIIVDAADPVIFGCCGPASGNTTSEAVRKGVVMKTLNQLGSAIADAPDATPAPQDLLPAGMVREPLGSVAISLCRRSRTEWSHAPGSSGLPTSTAGTA
ncbi:MAG: hypothetical protein WBA68_05570, partial [Alteraurantiacibacter sp.]